VNTEHMRRVEEVFDRAIDLSGAARSAFLDERCAGDEALRRDVLALLDAAEGEAGPLDQPHSGARAAPTPPPVTNDALIPPGGVIGRYRAVSVLGSGGMGVVYEAEQDKPRRSVALKVIRPGLMTPNILKRFEFEAEMLGRLQHPGIAQIIEAGAYPTAQGPQPYFAMELVRGVPLTKYCGTGGLRMSERLGLVLKVCDAVEHAHQRGVIHRDLKPANILVDATGQPKILDFGVARATGADEGGANNPRLTIVRTGEHQIIGTLGYMSPEQVSGKPGDVDTRSDVYALGVILYEIVSGRLPLDLSGRTLPEAARVVQEQDPEPLSTIVSTARGDLNTIAAKALEKDKSRRYQSAAALADDIRRFLRNEPISARPPSTMYQVRKFARRHRALVGAAVVVVLALTAGLIAASVGFANAARERDAAQVALAKQKRAAAMLKEMLSGVDPDIARGRDTFILRRMLDDWGAKLGTELTDQPEVELDLRIVVGETYRKLDQSARARAMFEAARTLARRVWGEKSAQFAEATQGLALATLWATEQEKSEPLFREALALRTDLFGPESAQAADSMSELGTNLRQLGRLEDGEKLLSGALEIKRRVHGEPSREVASTMNDLAMVYLDEGRLADAEALQTGALKMAKEVFGEDLPDTLRMMQNLGLVQYRLEHYAKAEATSRKVLAASERIFPGDSGLTVESLDNLSAALLGQGKYDEVGGLRERALRMSLKLYGPDSLDVASEYYNIASFRVETGDLDGAEQAAASALEIAHKAPEGARQARNTLYLLGQILRRREKFAAAEPKLRELLDLDRKALPANHPDIALSIGSLASTLLEEVWTEIDTSAPAVQLKRAEEAVTLQEEGLRITVAALGEAHWRAFITTSNLSHARAVRAMLRAMQTPAERDTALGEARSALSAAEASFEKLRAPDAVPAGPRPRVVGDAAKLVGKVHRALDRLEPGAGHAQEWNRWVSRGDRITRGDSDDAAPSR